MVLIALLQAETNLRPLASLPARRSAELRDTMTAFLRHNQQMQRTARNDNRPLLRDAGDRREVLRELFERREALYREIADLVGITDSRNARVLAREIEDHLARPATLF